MRALTIICKRTMQVCFQQRITQHSELGEALAHPPAGALGVTAHHHVCAQPNVWVVSATGAAHIAGAGVLTYALANTAAQQHCQHSGTGSSSGGSGKAEAIWGVAAAAVTAAQCDCRGSYESAAVAAITGVD